MNSYRRKYETVQLQFAKETKKRQSKHYLAKNYSLMNIKDLKKPHTVNTFGPQTNS